MWVFLATETLFFSGMLLAYTVLRHAYPEGFAEAGRETKIVIGSVNTAVLLTSSATMAWAVHAAKAGHRRLLTILLIATAALGLVFVGLKGLEYAQEYAEHLVPGAELFIRQPACPRDRAVLFSVFRADRHPRAASVDRDRHCRYHGSAGFAAARSAPPITRPVEVTGLYWHFVDLVWIFLFPLIYLNGPERRVMPKPPRSRLGLDRPGPAARS